VKTSISVYANHDRVRSLNQPVLINECKISNSMKQLESLMVFEPYLTSLTDIRPITTWPRRPSWRWRIHL